MTLQLLPDYASLRDFMLSLPRLFLEGEGTLLHEGRNQLRLIEHNGQEFVVKSFGHPNLINRFVYGFLRPSKAMRAFRNAQTLQRLGIGTPSPVGYLNIRRHGLFYESYLVTLASTCNYRYDSIIPQPDAFDDVVRAFAATTARLHEAGMKHLDYSRGNILFQRLDDGQVRVELIDLNRMAFGKVGLEAGCKNLERLPATNRMHRIMADVYAAIRGMDPEKCYEEMVKARKAYNKDEAF